MKTTKNNSTKTTKSNKNTKTTKSKSFVAAKTTALKVEVAPIAEVKASKATTKRAELLGMSATSAIRSMGKSGITTAQAVAVCEHFKVAINARTIATAIWRGNSGKTRDGSKIEALTAAQVATVNKIAPVTK